MTRTLKKIAVILLGVLFVFLTCFCVFSFSLNKKAVVFADNFYQEDDDVVIDTEYELESRFMPTTASSIGFSGNRFRDGSSMVAGHLFSSTTDGAKVTLGSNFGEVVGYGKNNENANKFSLVGMTVPNSKEDATEVFITWSFKTINFIITDNLDSNNVIVITFKGTTYAGSGVSGSGPINVTATYNGTALKTTANSEVINNLYRASFRNRFFDSAGFPFNLEFSKDDAKLNFYGLPTSGSNALSYLEDCTTISTGTKETFEIENLKGFESYTVEMQLCDFNYGPQDNNTEYKANVVLFEMSSQLLSNSNENVVDTAGPIVLQKYDEVVANKEYDLAEILSMHDLIDGKISAVGNTEGKYSVKIDGVNCDSGKYTFTAEKQYSLEYTIYDNYVKGSEAKTSCVKTINVNVVKDTVAPILSWGKNYKDAYYINTILHLLELDVNDDFDASPSVLVEVFRKNGEAWDSVSVTDKIVKLTESGEYKVKYTVTDFSNNSSVIEDTFTVSELSLNVADNIEEDFTTEMFYVPQLVLDEELSYYVEKFDGSDTEFSNGERILTRAIMFAEPTTFKLRYSIFSGNEENVIKTHVITVTLKAIPEEPPQQEPGETPPIEPEGPQGSFFTSVPFVIIVSAILLASIVLNVILFVKRRKNGKA